MSECRESGIRAGPERPSAEGAGAGVMSERGRKA
jgi:hypothetical protein